eukprot:COSAG05_NODE_10977_length_536_cov_1.247140_1_plen_69_part_10
MRSSLDGALTAADAGAGAGAAVGESAAPTGAEGYATYDTCRCPPYHDISDVESVAEDTCTACTGGDDTE